MQSFRLLHLSDLHLATKAGINNRITDGDIIKIVLQARPVDWPSFVFAPSFEKFAADALAVHISGVYEDEDAYDAIIVTGDIATTGGLDDLKAARDFVITPSTGGSWLKDDRTPTLNGGDDEIRMILMPGNHDRFIPTFENGRPSFQYQPGGTNFDRVFNDIWTAGKGVETFTITRGDEQLVVLCADFTLDRLRDSVGAWGWLGQGIVYEHRLNRLNHLTRCLQEQDNPPAIIWAIHFPPHFPDIEPNKRLIWQDDIISAAAELKIGFILSGHMHHQIRYSLSGDGSTLVLCAGTATACCSEVRQNQFQELDFNVNGDVIVLSDVEEFVLTDEDAAFVRATP